jgi:16S rRNA (guanine(527)-N(7))-methyltransferase RsmG
MDYPTIFDGSMKQPKYPSNVIDIIFEGSNQLGIALSENSLAGMAQHMELLAQWGKRINLTSLRDPVEIAVLHFIDSLTVFKVLPFASGMRILDIGTGAGFPGMVMKTADSSLKLTLLDRDTKKVVFLKHLAHKLGLTGITFLNMPLEVVLGKQGFHGFDAAISRAVSSDPDFMDSLCCLLQPTGLSNKNVWSRLFGRKSFFEELHSTGGVGRIPSFSSQIQESTSLFPEGLDLHRNTLTLCLKTKENCHFCGHRRIYIGSLSIL